MEYITNSLLTFETGSADEIGELRHGRTGMLLHSEISSEEVSKYYLVTPTGALVTTVAAGSVSDAAGFQRGDLIVAINNIPITNSSDLVERIKTLPTGKGVVFDIYRREQKLQIKLSLGDKPAVPTSRVFSLGHPAGQDWKWNSGYILSSQAHNFLSLSTTLSESGLSGGPLLDKHLRLIGIIVKQGGTRDTALRIEKVLKLVAQWQIPYKIWLTNEFCSNLNLVLNEAKSNFQALKVGAARRGLGGYWEKRWDSKIDLSGQNKTQIHKIQYGSYLIEAIMAEETYGNEADFIVREIAIAVKKCNPNSSLSSLEKGAGVIYGEGIKITYSPDGFWGSTQVIGIHKKYGSEVALRIHRRK